MDTWTNSNWWGGRSDSYAHWSGPWTPGLIPIGGEVVQRDMHTGGIWTPGLIPSGGDAGQRT